MENMGATNEQSERIETLARLDELRWMLLRIVSGMPVDLEAITKRMEALSKSLTSD